jgi:hypothetical protein
MVRLALLVAAAASSVAHGYVSPWRSATPPSSKGSLNRPLLVPLRAGNDEWAAEVQQARPAVPYLRPRTCLRQRSGWCVHTDPPQRRRIARLALAHS